MSKRCSKKAAGDRSRRILKLSLVKFDQQIPEPNNAIDINDSCYDRWNRLRTQCEYKSDQDFANFLLDLAEDYAKKKFPTEALNDVSNKSCSPIQATENVPPVSVQQMCTKEREHKKKSSSKEHHSKSKAKKIKNSSTALLENAPQCTRNSDENSQNLVKQEPGIENSNVIDKTKINDSKIVNNDILTTSDNPCAQEVTTVQETENNIINGTEKKPKAALKCNKKKSESVQQNSTVVPVQPQDSVAPVPIKNETQEQSPRVAIKIKLCQSCNSRHMQDNCPLQNPIFSIDDSITFEEWSLQGNVPPKIEETSAGDDESEENKNDLSYIERNFKTSYALISLPAILYLDNIDVVHGPGVFTNSSIEEFTQFGPLCGKIVKEVDIPEDFSMKHLWQIYTAKVQIFVNTEDTYESNWIRFLRPAPNRDSRNLMAISKDDKLYFVSSRKIELGEELLYWQDDGIVTNRKKMEKLNCGGCNITFAHPLYYRTHCSIFHDVRYSLTIRKYHCKVCGAAVLGKENIMKHAADLHNGQGAYQCQFCKKFFLRLNYLEMHRTYGCSANPHRSRPLCDFCGRKFCQPQKLKVHIKRMHSDMAEVLKEFQCKNCLKLLGSRAALQRHLKEVHNKQMDCSFSCKRCGKLFQNKSNLKIHMLTHSGIKPFKCKEDNCAAAFTTKQCLQFHYKKVHGFAEELMPKIERSIEYTFEAYSGLDEEDGPEMNVSAAKQTVQDEPKQSEVSLEESSDVDDISLVDKSMDEPPALHSPIPIASEHSSRSNPSPPLLEAYTNLPPMDVRILSKGSKKWLGEDPQQMNLILSQPPPQPQAQPQQQQQKSEDASNIMLEVDETQSFDRNKTLSMNLNVFSRHESTNASLLVEAALDSVSDIQIGTGTMDAGDDTLVNNLYPLPPPSTLPSMTYNAQAESRDLNLLSPSVNEHISVTDDLNDAPNIGMEYTLHHDVDRTTNFIREFHLPTSSTLSPRRLDYSEASAGNSPHYDMGNVSNDANLSSDDSNGLGAQNLSLHNTKEEAQLDLSMYKSHYSIDSSNFFLRRNIRNKDKKMGYALGLENSSEDLNVDDEKTVEEPTDTIEVNDKQDLVSKQLDSRNLYDSTDLDFRTKPYDLVDSIDTRGKTYADSALLESDFRVDRNFEPLILNSSELQGLDMTARSYHNFHPSGTVSRFHHIYGDVDRLAYSPPPPPSYPDVLRSVDLSLRSHSFIPGLGAARLPPLDQHSIQRHLSDHTTNRILANDQIASRILVEEAGRFMAQGGGGGGLSPPYPTNYSVSPNPFHPSGRPPSPTPSTYHHYSAYY